MTAPTSSTTCAGLGYDLSQVEQTGSNFGTEVRARDPVPELRRQRNDGRRRAVDHQRRLLQHVVPGVPGVDRAAQLPREQHRLSRAGQDRRQLPARDEGDGPARRRDPRRAWACSARRASRSRGRSSATAGSTISGRGDELRRSLAAKNRLQPAHHGRVPVRAVAALLRGHRARPGRRRPVRRRSGTSVVALAIVAQPRCSPPSTSCWSSAAHGVPAAAAAAAAPSTTRTSGGTSASGRCRPTLSARLQRHPVQERDLAAAGRPDRPPGLRRRLLHHRADARPPSATTARSTRGSKIQCHSQEDGTFKSDRTTIGAGCTLGVGAFVHYGVTMGDGAVLAADSFLMKGEEVPPHARVGREPGRGRCGTHAGSTMQRRAGNGCTAT